MLPRILALTLLAVGCSRDSSRSPACGLALIAGPTIIQQQLSNPRAVILDAPRGLPESLPAMVIQQQQAQVTVGYDADGRIVMGYRGTGFPTQGGYGLLVVDDTSQRAMGVLILESEEPAQHPRLGTIVGGSAALHLYGVRVDWASVSNPRCPLLGAPPPVTAPAPPAPPVSTPSS
ncbi:MAG: hypothetical protein Q8Q14_06250 [Gemmatimonadales bacterium]|nr:hypothetical protein [Gemmatimonadales bacterium]